MAADIYATDYTPLPAFCPTVSTSQEELRPLGRCLVKISAYSEDRDFVPSMKTGEFYTFSNLRLTSDGYAKTGQGSRKIDPTEDEDAIARLKE